MVLYVPAIIWFFLENDYFGWNRTAQSPEELICDGIVLVLVAIAIVGNIIRKSVI